MTRADILVIGGGIAGISAAARCAEAGARVVVLEREPGIGAHSTARSAAIFIANYGNATLRAINAASGPLLAEPDGLADHPLLTPRGFLIFADEARLPELAAMQAGATGMEALSAQQAIELAPILRPERIAGAVYEAEARDIDVDLLLNGFARLLRAHGGQVVTGAEVLAVERGQDWTVTCKAGSYSAPVVINAAGAWGDIVAQMAGLAPVGLVPMRRSAAILPAPDGENIAAWPLFGRVDDAWYAKPMGGRLMVSPAEEDPVAPHDAWPDDMVLAEGLDRFEQDVTMRVSRVERSWAGLRSFVPDRTLVAGFDANAKGFFWLVGQGGYGVQTAPAMAQLTADLCIGRTPVLADWVVNALSPNRFSTRKGADT
ncbi:FAD-binding oxidoreductase [Abyssibius alkaniclasticus]|uniref:NAD(P)/FAD-dependent oxidoreductase n=1 Tax=Abyssibius alkaniclasticus TaxID=2881234 RepID=UPI002363A8C0|nr:FAD-dependent oxidoreductase [Abyssibius alkaniclasticus]UPH72060.1 FAD-binding oxidoreductase [Abyssibius alkaniclasticus]